MIKRSIKNWEKGENIQGLLYFVQRMDELLFHHSLDTYKSPTLNYEKFADRIFGDH